MAVIAMLLNGTEISALLLLSIINSSYNFGFHRNSFIIFLLCSVIYMILSLIIWKSICANSTIPLKFYKALMYKRMFAFLNWFFLAGAAFFYYRHNRYCETGVYSLFSLCEYMIVLTNIGFHGTALIDFTALSEHMNPVKSGYLDV